MFEGNCESPIEDIFAQECAKYLDPGVAFDSQVWVDTQHGRFRIDFVLSQSPRRVAVECDGEDFHDQFRDEFRDAILLGEMAFPEVYHFRGCDLVYHPEDCLWLMSTLTPTLFTGCGRLHLERLHRLEPIPSLCRGDTYTLADPDDPYQRIWVFRRNIYSTPGRPYWKVLYEFARQHPHADLDELLNLRAEWRIQATHPNLEIEATG